MHELLRAAHGAHGDGKRVVAHVLTRRLCWYALRASCASVPARAAAAGICAASQVALVSLVTMVKGRAAAIKSISDDAAQAGPEATELYSLVRPTHPSTA